MRSLILSLLLPAVASAQIALVAPGSRIRATIPAIIPEPIHATFAFAVRDSVWLQNTHGRTSGGLYTAPRLALRLEQITSMEVRVGKDRERGAAIGFFIGGAVTFALLAAPDNGNEFADLGAMAAGVVLVPFATVVGAVVGVEQWRQVLPAPARR